MHKALIVDDHESMRDSLQYALTKRGNFIIVGSLASADQAEDFCRQLPPDLILMDVCTENGASGLVAAEKIKLAKPEIKIIVMSGFDEISYAVRAKDAGADAFVMKSKSLDYFIKVAEGVMSGNKYFPTDKAIRLSFGEAPLTKREMEVLRLVCKNMTSKEIAAELFISENTVKYHKSNMLTKTGYSSMIELAFHMISNGWINPLF